jgi:hypothetical protein
VFIFFFFFDVILIIVKIPALMADDNDAQAFATSDSSGGMLATGLFWLLSAVTGNFPVNPIFDPLQLFVL